MIKATFHLKTLLALITLGLTLVFLNSLGYLQMPKALFLSAVSPVESRFSTATHMAGDLFFTVQQIGEFKERSENLYRENQRLQSEVVALKEVRRENESLKNLLQFKRELCGDKECLHLVPGKVTGRGLNDYGKSLIINLGSRQGARKNLPVVTDTGIMIGKVEEVFDQYSKVLLTVSPESSLNVIDAVSRANGLLKGEYYTGLRLEKINQSEKLTEGDLLLTSGLEENIPRGLIVGKITKVKESPNEIFKSAEVELPVEISRVENIFLVESYEQGN